MLQKKMLGQQLMPHLPPSKISRVYAGSLCGNLGCILRLSLPADARGLDHVLVSASGALHLSCCVPMTLGCRAWPGAKEATLMVGPVVVGAMQAGMLQQVGGLLQPAVWCNDVVHAA